MDSNFQVPIVFGDEEEKAAFVQRNERIISLLPDLARLAERVFGSTIYTLTPPSVIAYGLLSTATEIFAEIVCLAANSFGRAALARVRTMFEFVALAAYFVQEPNEAEKFIEFENVERVKDLRRAKGIFAKGNDPQALADLEAELLKLEARVDLSKKRFGKDFVRSWHQGFEKIAQELGWEHHFFYNYLLPNKYVHASALLLERRTELINEGSSEEQLMVDYGPDSGAADEALRSACTLLILDYAVANDLLKLGEPTAIEGLSKALIEMYKGVPNRHKI